MKKIYEIPTIETVEIATKWALCALDGSGGTGLPDPTPKPPVPAPARPNKPF